MPFCRNSLLGIRKCTGTKIQRSWIMKRWNYWQVNYWLHIVGTTRLPSYLLNLSVPSQQTVSSFSNPCLIQLFNVSSQHVLKNSLCGLILCATLVWTAEKDQLLVLLCHLFYKVWSILHATGFKRPHLGLKYIPCHYNLSRTST